MPATRPVATIDQFATSLASELTILDGKINARPREPFNIYRLGIYLEAAEDCCAAIYSGKLTREESFSRCFTPCRDMHTVAKHLGLALDVQHGRWVFKTHKEGNN